MGSMEALKQLDPDAIEVTMVAEILNLSEATLATWRSRGHGPHYYRVGRKVYYRAADVKQWLASQRVEVPGGNPRSQRKVASAVPDRRQRGHAQHRLGGHSLKPKRGVADRSGIAASATDGQADYNSKTIQ